MEQTSRFSASLREKENWKNIDNVDKVCCLLTVVRWLKDLKNGYQIRKEKRIEGGVSEEESSLRFRGIVGDFYRVACLQG